jgi:hypothetical protein
LCIKYTQSSHTTALTHFIIDLSELRRKAATFETVCSTTTSPKIQEFCWEIQRSQCVPRVSSVRHASVSSSGDLCASCCSITSLPTILLNPSPRFAALLRSHTSCRHGQTVALILLSKSKIVSCRAFDGRPVSLVRALFTTTESRNWRQPSEGPEI